MQGSLLTSTVLFHLGPIAITRPVVTTWAIMIALTVTSRLVTSRLGTQPDGRQAVLEILVAGIARQIEDVIRKDARPFLPMLGTLFIFLVAANPRRRAAGYRGANQQDRNASRARAHRALLGPLLRRPGAGISRPSRELCRTQAHHAAAQYSVRGNTNLFADGPAVRQHHERRSSSSPSSWHSPACSSRFRSWPSRFWSAWYRPTSSLFSQQSSSAPPSAAPSSEVKEVPWIPSSFP